MMKYTQEEIIDLAKNVELDDSIDWSQTHLDRDKVYQIVGSQVYEYYGANWDNDKEDKEAIMLAAITKLVVENFVLNVRVNADY